MREEVRLFAEQMEKNLRKDDFVGGWKSCDLSYLMDKLGEQTGELAQAVLIFMSALTVRGITTGDLEEYKKDVAYECADAANLLMMIADNIKELPDIRE